MLVAVVIDGQDVKMRRRIISHRGVIWVDGVSTLSAPAPVLPRRRALRPIRVDGDAFARNMRCVNGRLILRAGG